MGIIRRHRQEQQADTAAKKPAFIEIPGLGPVVRAGIAGEDEYVSEPIWVPALGAEFDFSVEGYDADERPQDFHAAIESFLDLDRSVLEDAAGQIYAYYKDVRDRVEDEDEDEVEDEDSFPDIAGRDDVLDHIEPGDDITVVRDPDGDRAVCVAVLYRCDWERLQDMQIVFRGGRVVSRVGPFDGRMS